MKEAKTLIKNIESGSKNLELKNKKMNNSFNLSNLFNEIVIFLGQVILLILFSFLYIKGYIKSIGLITTLNIISGIYCFFGSSSVKSLISILAHKNVIKLNYSLNNEEVDNEQNEVSKVNSIEYKNLSFKHEDNEKEIIKNFSLKIYKGEKILIKGESGVGKTTLLKMLYNPKFKIDG
ncbi:ABC transporter ATP-binding protein [Spiroplasma gladiatoris]|uniref:ABC transporter ATP-binding protein n=1 Tax=Spiroplasma gladiatoris TaxID=2143 RepID=A0A4P7AJB4_9MOLU|nr:ATP-binding cassette domain-containing protein [Spiroplasma gladiatoris]QBQ07620.1 ABC transporter ATP-binding protein [Spiroplasma gladiatoris]